ncbi:hypothetical protein SLEP1_g23975 [Rubroshorea leprosula]|uniref:Uncharacterized protein n=1 Tax=Rubroshorea leprosula TaxID=152421 RepID=A0AAV5JNE9_9ROSI|nr:hypothetical protein SLEP1_g23975 [Rubroshorea leprosula]
MVLLDGYLKIKFLVNLLFKWPEFRFCFNLNGRKDLKNP